MAGSVSQHARDAGSDGEYNPRDAHSICEVVWVWVWDGMALETSGRRLLGPDGGRDLGGLWTGRVSTVTKLELEPEYFGFQRHL